MGRIELQWSSGFHKYSVPPTTDTDTGSEIGMREGRVVVANRLGLHARAAAKLVQLCSQFSAEVTIKKDEERADAKQMIDLLMLAACQGSALTLKVDGVDEDTAFEEIQTLIQGGFGEES